MVSSSHRPIRTVVVGYGLAAQVFHIPLIVRQPALRLSGLVIRDSAQRQQATTALGVNGYPSLDAALADPATDLIVLATPHDTHVELTVQTLEAGKHCVVDKVMALDTAGCDRMIAARDRSGCMLSVFQNRRWDWDYAVVKRVLADSLLGNPRVITSQVDRYSAPRAWRGQLEHAGTILHDWGAHLVDQALQLGLGPCRRLTAWLVAAPWPGVDAGGLGRITMEFDSLLYEIQVSRMTPVTTPRWLILGTEGTFQKCGIDPQEAALRAGNLDAASEPAEHRGQVVKAAAGAASTAPAPEARASWDSYYAGIARHLTDGEPLPVTAEEAREVVRVLDAAVLSAQTHQTVSGPWGI